MNYAMGNGPEGPSRSAGSAPKKASAEVLQRWGRDMASMEDSIGLMLANRLQEAEKKLEAAAQEVAERSIDFAAGEHDLRGCFTFVGALMSLINGLASLENNQLDTVLERVWAADEQLSLDGDWAGRTVLRGLCLLVAGVVEIMQGMPSKGIWHVLRSWLWLRNLESEALNFEGHERGCVRSTALLALGVFNLFVSMLPPTAMKAAGWATGFTGGRDVALGQLRACWEEGGLQAPFAGMVLIGFAVDVSSFLGELREERDERHSGAREILDWANERYPNAFFFAGLEAGYLAATRDLDGALAKLDSTNRAVEKLPAFTFLVNVRRATLLLSKFQWEEAGDAFAAAVEVYRSVGRRALCPSLSLNSHLCYARAGCSDRAAEMLALCRSYQQEKKKWSPLDRTSLRQADLAHREALKDEEARPSSKQSEGAFSPPPRVKPESEGSDASVAESPLSGVEEDQAEEADASEETWRPTMLLYLKICLVYRAVNFMKPEAAKEFLDMVRKETDLQEDANGRCMGLCIQAEAMRQGEQWEEALRLASEGCALRPDLTNSGLKSGAVHFCHLVAAFAHYAQGRPGAAQEALSKLSAIGASDHFFQKQVEFKATHLRRLVGAEFKESYRDISVPARSKARLIVDIPEGAASVQWDFILVDFTIDFVALFTSSAEGSEPQELQKIEQHQADAGPCEGRAEKLGAGRLELVFSNSFSMLRGKTVQCRVQPENLTVRLEAR